MTQDEFENILTKICSILTNEAIHSIFTSSAQFENRVREVLQDEINTNSSIIIDFSPHPQAFPDIAVGRFGIEVKFTLNDTWRSIANSVLETNRIELVEKIYLVFGKMGGEREVRWGHYEQSVIHSFLHSSHHFLTIQITKKRINSRNYVPI